MTSAARSRSVLPASAAASSHAWVISAIAERPAWGSSKRWDTAAAPTRTGVRGSRLMAGHGSQATRGAAHGGRPTRAGGMRPLPCAAMRALVISHDPSEVAGRVGLRLEQHGYRLEVLTV